MKNLQKIYYTLKYGAKNMVDTVNAKEVWLNYFNKVLFEKKIITEKEFNKITNLIKRQNNFN